MFVHSFGVIFDEYLPPNMLTSDRISNLFLPVLPENPVLLRQTNHPVYPSHLFNMVHGGFKV